MRRRSSRYCLVRREDPQEGPAAVAADLDRSPATHARARSIGAFVRDWSATFHVRDESDPLRTLLRNASS